MNRRAPPPARSVKKAPLKAAGKPTLHPVLLQIQPLLQAGRIAEAAALCDQEIEAGCDDHMLMVQTLRLRLHLGKNQEAYDLGQTMLARRPGDLDAHFQSGLAAMRINRYQAALDHFQAVLRAKPDYVEGLTNLSAVYFGLGFISDALEPLKKALKLAPNLVPLWQNYLSMSNYDESMSLADSMAIHRQAGAAIARAAGKPTGRWPDIDPAEDRPLRIGYLSGDFFNHPAAHYIEPVLRLHDRSRFELFAYSLIGWSDAVTEAFRGMVPNWRDASLADDDALFRMIEADRIDILVDLSGHTARNRILTVARKPAPVVINWIGYLNTMGMETVDYAVLDPHLLSPAAEAGFVEAPLRLPHVAYCYTPLIGGREPAESPWRRNGFITFGCFNNPAKLSGASLAAWAEILLREPDSRLLFKYKTYAEPMVQHKVVAALTAAGVDPARIRFEGFSPLGSFFDTFAAIDVALDSFPYTGVTTTMHTLFMGTPLVTLEGDTPMQRFGRTALTAVGRPDWIARTPAEYVEKALAAAGEVKVSPDLRRDLQRRMLASPMMRHDQFVRDLENAYRDAWRRSKPGAADVG